MNAARLSGGFEWMHSLGYGPLDEYTPLRDRIVCTACGAPTANILRHWRDRHGGVPAAREVGA